MKILFASLTLIAAFLSSNVYAEMRQVAATKLVTEQFQAFVFGSLNEKITGDDDSGGGYGRSRSSHPGLNLSVDLFTNACSISTFSTRELLDRAGVDQTLELLKASNHTGERTHRQVLLAERRNGVIHCRAEIHNYMRLILANGVLLESSPRIVVLEATGQECIDRYNQMKGL